MSQVIKDYFFLHIIVLTWGFTAVLGLLIDIPPVEMVFFRTGLSAIGIMIIMGVRGLSFRLDSSRSTKQAVLVGVLLGAHWILFFLSARLSNASVCLAAMATTSLWTSLIEPVYFKKKIQAFEVSLGLVAFIGMIIIFNVEVDYLLGLILAVVSAILAALFTVINSQLTQGNHHFTLTFYEMLFACLSIVLFFPFYRFYFSEGDLVLLPTLSDWGYLLILAGVCTVFAYSYSIKLMKRLSAFSVNLSVNLEPIYGILLALIIFGESEEMKPGFYLGTGLIMLSVLAYPILNKRYNKKPIETDILR
jgi:drug/metabolite transporter (DMT)-like permease